MLPADRVRILKLHLTVSAQTQRQRIASLRSSKLTRWRVTREDRWLVKHHDAVAQATELCLNATHTKASPWRVIDGSDPQRRRLRRRQSVAGRARTGIQGDTYAGPGIVGPQIRNPSRSATCRVLPMWPA